MNKGRFYIEKKSFCAGACTICMFLTILFRALGSIPKLGEASWLVVNFVVPAGAALLFILLVALLGNKAFWTTFVPVLVWVGFFVIKEFANKENELFMIVMIFVYLAIGIVYGCTVFGAIGTKWILVPLFLLPVAYNVAMKDWPVIIGTKTATFPAIMIEMSVICLLLGLFFASLGLRKKVVASAAKSEGIVPPIPGGVAVKSEKEPVVSNPAVVAPAEPDLTESEPSQEIDEEVNPESNEA